ncbi:hypothetical protein [Lichenifustis flavocetrariae]|uniref:Uncharacterized protein n=1 Tax=Lichenifustis flavocetrariae TaxID=2949735 RepID=A0AA41Z144_9HYPH|nr:hypothetical protein [Lichenifustis flavocetrariae]MCW6510920.1 hypothetical protein [Lichenifustis flavocetrariae]
MPATPSRHEHRSFHGLGGGNLHRDLARTRILRGVVYGYLERVGVSAVPRFGIDNFAMAMSLVQANDGVALLPASIEVYLPTSWRRDCDT